MPWKPGEVSYSSEHFCFPVKQRSLKQVDGDWKNNMKLLYTACLAWLKVFRSETDLKRHLLHFQAKTLQQLLS